MKVTATDGYKSIDGNFNMSLEDFPPVENPNITLQEQLPVIYPAQEFTVEFAANSFLDPDNSPEELIYTATTLDGKVLPDNF